LVAVVVRVILLPPIQVLRVGQVAVDRKIKRVVRVLQVKAMLAVQETLAELTNLAAAVAGLVL
jgi:hypothetical protein